MEKKELQITIKIPVELLKDKEINREALILEIAKGAIKGAIEAEIEKFDSKKE